MSDTTNPVAIPSTRHATRRRPSTPIRLAAESVTEGHPDKLADRIADAILDAHLAQDPHARVACEVLLAGNHAVLAGEITSNATVDHTAVARGAIRRSGYDRPDLGFDADSCSIDERVQIQSAEIAAAVDAGGAGDQCQVFGYACKEASFTIPAPLGLSHALCQRLDEVRRSGELEWLRPDGKAQVVIEYRDGFPHRVASVLVSCQHDPAVVPATLEAEIRDRVIAPVLAAHRFSVPEDVLVNPSGQFTLGGPAADTGLTGRKLAVDTYGGLAPHGGGAFSGKDPSKLDRSAAYMARAIARALTESNLADRALVQIAYAIGRDEPTSLFIQLDGQPLTDRVLLDIITTTYPLAPVALIDRLDLRRPIYEPLSVYGHFGRTDLDLPWERSTNLRVMANTRRHGDAKAGAARTADDRHLTEADAARAWGKALNTGDASYLLPLLDDGIRITSQQSYEDVVGYRDVTDWLIPELAASHRRGLTQAEIGETQPYAMAPMPPRPCLLVHDNGQPVHTVVFTVVNSSIRQVDHLIIPPPSTCARSGEFPGVEEA